MNLKTQILDLMASVPPNILEPPVMEKIVIPMLVAQAKRLRLAHVYTWSNREGKQVLLTLDNAWQSQQISGVIYAFASAEDARTHPDFDPVNLTLTQEPILRLLFEVLTHPQINLLCVFRSGNRSQADTFVKAQLRKLFTEKAGSILRTNLPNNNKLPADYC
jgi:hypothetical protein